MSEGEMEYKGKRGSRMEITGYRREITEEEEDEEYESFMRFNKTVSILFNKTALNKRIEELKKKIAANEAKKAQAKK